MSAIIGSFNFSKLQVHVTEKCNLKCKFCFNTNTNLEISVKAFQDLYNSSSEMNFSSLCLTGGEPLLHSRFFELIEIIDIPFSIFTNAIMLRKRKFLENFLTAIKNKDLQHIQVSLDGLNSNILSRGISYKIILDSLRVAKQNNINCIVATSISEININELIDIYYEIKNIGIDIWRICIAFPVKVKNSTQTPDLCFDTISKKLENLLQINAESNKSMQIDISSFCTTKKSPELNRDINFHAVKEFYAEKNTCASCSKSITIRSNGDITVCDALKDAVLGNISNNNWSLSDALTGKNRIVRNLLEFDQIKTNNHCLSCKFLLVCHGGCLGHVSRWNNTFSTPDPIACNLMSRSQKSFELINYNKFVNKNGFEPFFKQNGSKKYISED